jgi:hypothetical protein
MLVQKGFSHFLLYCLNRRKKLPARDPPLSLHMVSKRMNVYLGNENYHYLAFDGPAIKEDLAETF